MKRLLLSSTAGICLGMTLLVIWMLAIGNRTESVQAQSARMNPIAIENVQAFAVTRPLTFTAAFTTYLPIIFAPFVWKSDFENGFAGWGHVQRQGGTTEAVSDPTSSGKGLVQQSTIGAGNSPPVEETPGALVYRLYPGIFFSFHPAPCEVKEDVWVSQQLVEAAIAGDNNLVVGPDIFESTPQDGGKWNSAMQAVINRKTISGGKVYLRLYHAETGGVLGTLEPESPEFSAEQWHTIRIFVEQNGDVRLYQGGMLVSKGKWPSDTSRTGTVGGHPGAYAYNWYESSPPFQGMMLIDNYEIRCW